MEDFSKSPGDKHFNKMKVLYVMFVDTVVSVKTDSLDAPSVSSEVSL
jgi:hypothetical protein